MNQVQTIPNHTVDPKTGFLESKAYPYAFDAEKKALFLEVYRNNGLTVYGTCTQLGIKHDTFIKHYRNDPAFKDAFDNTEREYADELQGVSRRNALNPKSVIERIFQLKALYPDKYGDSKTPQATQVNISIDSKLLDSVKKRDQVIEAEIITGSQTDDVKAVDNQVAKVPGIDVKGSTPGHSVE